MRRKGVDIPGPTVAGLLLIAAILMALVVGLRDLSPCIYLYVCSPSEVVIDRHTYDPSGPKGFLVPGPFLSPLPTLNSIGLEELAALPGVGLNTAQKILAYKSSVGFILTPQELLGPVGPLDQVRLGVLCQSILCRP